MIPFTQYMVPNGVEHKGAFACKSDDVQKKADRFIKAGGWFECEVLGDSQVSLTACFNVAGEDQDVAIQISNNSELIFYALADLVEDAIDWLDGEATR